MINDIIEEVFKKGSIYNEILDNIMGIDNEYKGGMISEIALNWLEKPDKVIDAYNNNYLKYYFIGFVQLQLFSKTSPFARKNKSYSTWNKFHLDLKPFDTEEYMTAMNDDVIEQKIEDEIKLELIEESLIKGDLSWIETQLFKEYYYDDKSYRDIEREYSIDHCQVWKIVTSARKKVISYTTKTK